MDQDNNQHEHEQEVLEPEAAETESVETSDEAGADFENKTREELLEDVKRLAHMADDYKTRYLRAQADFDNFRRRSRQEKEEFATYANVKILEELLPVLDTFDMALKTQEGSDVKMLLAGIEMVHRQLITTLGNYGLQEIGAVGQPFDPNLHEGIMQVESAEHPANTVVEELRKGYKVKDKVVRPSMVKVSQ
ncbi:nucleotide exchange factor GrpE [Tumebacillus sp. DT12]|uniref:Protein GrpE n=1 Tax=Tumebacillus lacus TaxID=2995335 RepID=A0ABT3X1N6_9BACL|nr:nucleotide exchange factor GrpE [Tumebacillus lacus]MCX7570809.1 nucleotide exchange factor GrpE [Tumebacillus lacus]